MLCGADNYFSMHQGVRFLLSPRIQIVRGLCRHRETPARQRLTEAESPGEQVLRRVINHTTLDQYNQLMDLLITSPIELCNEVLNRIRQQDEIVTILRELGRDSLQSETSGPTSPSTMPGLDSIASPWASGTSQVGQGPMDVDTRREGWTSVTGDNELISHLIELYFTWQHIFFQNFPEDLFRRDFERSNAKYAAALAVAPLDNIGC